MSPTRRSFIELSAATAAASVLPKDFFGQESVDAALCRKLAGDPLRPQYHLLPAHNWMNDPNGPIFFGGRYHMFHQYNPQGAIWGNMNWAHATSPDMFHWHHEPIAISPTPGGPDQDGVFSGSAVLDNGKPAMIYTGVAPPHSAADATLRDGAHTWRESQCLAVAQDNQLRTWKKVAEPVISGPPAGLQVTGFRDPVVWREGDKWMLILGSGFRDKGGAILLYSSSDLRHWTYLHPLVDAPFSGKAAVNPVDTGDMWECPDFFPIGNKHVLLISTMGKVRWKVGTYADHRFEPEREGVVDWGNYYAAKTMLDRNGRRILWGWISESRPDADLIKAGWAGAMSLPRVLSLSATNELETAVAPEVEMLRSAHVGSHEPETSPQNLRVVEEVRIQNLAAEVDLHLSNASEFRLRLHSGNGDFATIACSDRELTVNQTSARFTNIPHSSVKLHIFLDGSVMEIFVNESIAMTARVYQIPSGPLRLKLEGDAKVLSIGTWEIIPISKDRLTGSMCSQKTA